MSGRHAVEGISQATQPVPVRWMLEQFRTLLEGAASDPDHRLSSLPTLPEGQRPAPATGIHRVRATNPFVEFPPEEIEQSITERFERQARRHPSRLAIVAASRRWTYERLAREADRVARVLRGLAGEGPQRVALLFEQDAPMIAAMLGSLAAGKTYVPLDPLYPTDRLRYMLQDAGVTLLLTEDRNLSLANSVAAGGCVVASLDRLRAGPTSAAVVPVSPDTVAYILYTSGSTGRPKGVVQNHRNVLHFIRAYTNGLHIRNEDRLSLLASYCFDAAVMDIFGALLNGSTLCLWNVKERGVSGLAEWLEEEAITVFHAVPTVFREFGDTLNEGQRLSKVRLVVLGGEEVRRGDVDVYRSHFSKDCLFVNGLGPTESTVALQYFLDQSTETRRGTVPVGYPVEDTEILLLDEQGRAAELYGEIAIRSPHVALGYWGKPEATEAAFLPDPQGGTRRIYRTGDLGRLLPDGAIEFVGRKGSRVKIRGHRIELAEIEQTLTEHPSVRNVVVVLREQTPADQRLIAYLVGTRERAVNTSEVRSFLEGKLPDFMIPSSFVWLDSLPLTPSGKVDRAALPSPAAEGQNRPQVSDGPRSALESQLVQIWERTLQVRPIGVNDNFFELGGHSLLAVRLLTQVEKAIGRSLPFSALFQAQTVAAMATRLEQNQRAPSPWSSLLTIQTKGPRPPLFCVHAQGSNALEYRGFTSHLGNDQPIYGLVPQGLDGRLPPHDRVEDMAAHYIAEIRKVQPEGPYYLGGWSFGGIIAFEMARQLRTAGQDIALLALFDTYTRPWSHTARRRSSLRTNLRFIWQRLCFHHAAVWRLEPRARARYIGGKVRSALSWSRRKLDALLGSAYASVRRPLPEAVARTHAAHRRAAAAYVPQAYDGHVTLFRATGLGVTSFDDPYLGWGEVPGIDIEVIEVPGAHVSLLRDEANVSVLADKLAKRLRLAQGSEGREARPRPDRAHNAPAIEGTALVVCDGFFATRNGKTAHGLVRGTDRYRVLGVVDAPTAGRDAGEVLDGKPRRIPIFGTIPEALRALGETPDFCVVGVATSGGRVTPGLRALLLEAIAAGMSVVNGLHECLSDDAELSAAAAAKGVTIRDVRKTPKRADLHFWSGEILEVEAPRIAVLGTDCALGKRTTARFVLDACRRAGLRSELIFTGQTGWMQGAPYGFILDSIPNDFVSGELEHAVVSCWRNARPDLILFEGQSSLRNPSGPCGSEFLLSGGATGVILQHAPGRIFYEGFEELGLRIPPLSDEIALIERYGAETLAVTLNGEHRTAAELRADRERLQAELRLPVVLPLEDGVESLVPVVRDFVARETRRPRIAASVSRRSCGRLNPAAHGLRAGARSGSGERR